MDSRPAVWYAIPSARPDGGTLRLWRRRGYKVAAYTDMGSPSLSLDLQDIGEYDGYANTVNFLCKRILEHYPDTQIIVTGGDDIDPPEQDPYEIQEQFVQHFPDLYGVMQPTGDRWMVDDQGLSCSERVAYSPWMGRAWIQEANQGRGPLWTEYFHFYVDEELQHVAQNQGVFWQRPDLAQYHHWWGRSGEVGKRPPHLVRTEAGPLWQEAKQLFTRRFNDGFPGSERLAPKDRAGLHGSRGA